MPSYIIPTVTDLVHEFGRMAAREKLLSHFLSTFFIATLGFVVGSLLGAAIGYILGMSRLLEMIRVPAGCLSAAGQSQHHTDIQQSTCRYRYI